MAFPRLFFDKFFLPGTPAEAKAPPAGGKEQSGDGTVPGF